MGAWKNTSYRFTENLKHRFVRRKKKKTATSSAITSPPIQTDPKVYELRCLNCPFGPSPERRILSWNVALKCWSDGIYKCFFKLESKRRPLNIPRVRAPDVVQLGWNRGILWWTAEVQTMGQSQGYVFFGCKISAVVTLWIVVIHFRKSCKRDCPPICYIRTDMDGSSLWRLVHFESFGSISTWPSSPAQVQWGCMDSHWKRGCNALPQRTSAATCPWQVITLVEVFLDDIQEAV